MATSPHPDDAAQLPQTLPQNSRVLFAAQMIVAVLVVCLAFWPNLTSFFQSDELDHLYFVQKSGPLGILVNAPADYFRPMHSLSMWLEWQLWHFHPAGYHASHLALHTVNVFLVYFLGRSFGFPVRTNRAAAALFLVLPGHGEAVAWMADRGGLLVTIFGLGCLLAYVLGRLRQDPKWLAVSVACFLAALASKEAAVTLPLVLLLAEFLVVKAQRPEGTISRLPFLLFGVLPFYFALRRACVGSFFGGPNGPISMSPVAMVGGIVRALPATVSPTTASVLGFAVAAVVSLGVLGVLFFRAAPTVRRSVLVLVSLFFASGLPSFWTTISPPVWGFDTRILYFASAFACLGFAVLLAPLRFFGIGLRLLFLLFAFQSWQIFGRWHEAGEWVRNGLEDLGKLPPTRRLILLDNPDMRFPAYVFRRGLISGLILNQSRNAPTAMYAPVQVVFYSDRDSVTVSSTSASKECVVTVHYAQPPLRRTSIWNSDLSAAPISRVGTSSFSYRFSLPPPEPGDQIVYFSEGHFRLWNRSQTP